MTTIFTAQKQIAELITAETVPNSNMPTDPLVYEGKSHDHNVTKYSEIVYAQLLLRKVIRSLR
jgi:hypothetical protein